LTHQENGAGQTVIVTVTDAAGTTSSTDVDVRDCEPSELGIPTYDWDPGPCAVDGSLGVVIYATGSTSGDYVWLIDGVPAGTSPSPLSVSVPATGPVKVEATDPTTGATATTFLDGPCTAPTPPCAGAGAAGMSIADPNGVHVGISARGGAPTSTGPVFNTGGVGDWYVQTNDPGFDIGNGAFSAQFDLENIPGFGHIIDTRDSDSGSTTQGFVLIMQPDGIQYRSASFNSPAYPHFLMDPAVLSGRFELCLKRDVNGIVTMDYRAFGATQWLSAPVAASTLTSFIDNSSMSFSNGITNNGVAYTLGSPVVTYNPSGLTVGSGTIHFAQLTKG